MNVRVNDGQGPAHRNMMCAVCRDKINDAAKVCAGCGVTTHPDCANDKCPTIGCTGSAAMVDKKYKHWQYSVVVEYAWRRYAIRPLQVGLSVCAAWYFISCLLAGSLQPLSSAAGLAIVLLFALAYMLQTIHAAAARRAYLTTMEILLRHPEWREEAARYIETLKHKGFDHPDWDEEEAERYLDAQRKELGL